MPFANPQYLVETDWVETDWLADNLGDSGLRVLDCTVYLPNYFEDSAGDEG